MELFVYVRMGGKAEDAAIKLLTGGHGGKEELASRFASFDASRAQCYLRRDRERLLAVVESAFGTTEPFNKIVIEIFDHKLFQGDLRTRRRRSSCARRLSSKGSFLERRRSSDALSTSTSSGALHASALAAQEAMPSTLQVV